MRWLSGYKYKDLHLDPQPPHQKLGVVMNFCNTVPSTEQWGQGGFLECAGTSLAKMTTSRLSGEIAHPAPTNKMENNWERYSNVTFCSP